MLVFGLLQLVLSDHDGPIDRRAGGGWPPARWRSVRRRRVATGVVTVGLTTLVRRGGGRRCSTPRRSVFCTALGWLHYGNGPKLPYTIHQFSGPGFAPVLRACSTAARPCVVGWRSSPCSWRVGSSPAPVRRGRAPPRLALPAAMLVGSALFLMITGVNRGLDRNPIRGPRAGTCTSRRRFCFPVLAVAGDALDTALAAAPPDRCAAPVSDRHTGNITATGNDFLNERFYSTYDADRSSHCPAWNSRTESRATSTPSPINGPGSPSGGWSTPRIPGRSRHRPSADAPPSDRFRLRLASGARTSDRGVRSSCQSRRHVACSGDLASAPGQRSSCSVSFRSCWPATSPEARRDPVAFGASLLSGGGPIVDRSWRTTLDGADLEPTAARRRCGVRHLLCEADLCGLPAGS